MCRRYFIHLAYNGANYCGWQSQPNATTVQDTIEHALSVLLRSSIPIVGAGRTDSGVHARSMIAHFDLEAMEIDTIQLAKQLNNFLPKDISIYEIREVKNDAHARFDALSRTYKYYVTTIKDPFMFPFKYKLFHTPDVVKMNQCARILFDYEDFTSFSKLHTDVKTNNCKIMQAYWEQDEDDFIFTIQADRFLRNMVRAIVGTLLKVGSNKMSEDEFIAVIEAKDRSKAGSSAPGNALFLHEVAYESDIYLGTV